MGAGFDKAKWLEETAAKVEKAQQALTQGLQALITGEDWRRVLEAAAHLGPASVARFSFRNFLLLQVQRPGTTHAATFEGWKRLGRRVKKGEKAAVLLRPRIIEVEDKKAERELEAEEVKPKLVGFRLMSVFGLEQTDGAPLSSLVPPDLNQPEAFEDSVETLRRVALALPGAPVSSVLLRGRRPSDMLGARGWYVPATREIVVLADTGSPAHVFRVLCHEVAHALLHPQGDHHSRPEQEVEAESVAFIVCHALGLDTGDISFPYVAGWARGEDALEMVAQSGQRVVKAAQTLLSALLPEMMADLEQAA